MKGNQVPPHHLDPCITDPLVPPAESLSSFLFSFRTPHSEFPTPHSPSGLSMPYVKAKELRRRFELDGPHSTLEHVREALTQRHLKPEDFSLRDLAEHFCGSAWVRALDPRQDGLDLLEAAGDGVDVTAFR